MDLTERRTCNLLCIVMAGRNAAAKPSEKTSAAPARWFPLLSQVRSAIAPVIVASAGRQVCVLYVTICYLSVLSEVGIVSGN